MSAEKPRPQLGDLGGRLDGQALLDSLVGLDEAVIKEAYDVVEFVVDALLEESPELLDEWAVPGAPGRYAFALAQGRFMRVRVSGARGSERVEFGGAKIAGDFE